MKIAVRLALLTVVAALGFWLWTIFFPSPEKVIRGKMASLAATAKFNASDGNLTRATKVSNLISYFTTDAEINLDASGLPVHSLAGRDEIRDTARAGLMGLSALKAEFLDVTISVSADKQTARVSCTARVTAGNSKDFDVQEMHFQFKKVDRSWLIARVETVKTLS